MKIFRTFVLASIIISTIKFVAPAQTYKFKLYGIEQGICHSVIYDINQDKNGFIWIGTGEGLCRYNGFEFSSLSGDTLSEGLVTTIFKDKNQDLWFGFNTGDIIKYNGTTFTTVENPFENKTEVVAFAQDSKNNMLVATQNSGIISIDDKLNTTTFTEFFNDLYITAFAITADDKLLIGTFDGLFLVSSLSADKPSSVLQKITELEYIKIQTIFQSNAKNDFLIGTEDAGIFTLSLSADSYSVENTGQQFGLEWENIQSVMKDNKNNIWISTFGSGVYRLNYNETDQTYSGKTQFSVQNGLNSKNIKCVFQDNGDNIWIGTYGNGLANMADEAFTYFNFNDYELGNNVITLVTDDDNLWLGGENGVMRIDINDQSKYDFYGTKNGLPSNDISALYLDDKLLWIGTKNEGIYILNTGSKKIKENRIGNNTLSNAINHITGDETSIWVSTKDGVYIVSKQSGKINHFSTNDGLPHNNILQVFLDGDKAWLATKSNGLCFIKDQKEIGSLNSKGLREIDYTSITKDNEDNYWAATSGIGVIRFNEDTLINISVREGLKSSYCYSIINDISGNVFVGHRLGISRINTENMAVKTYGAEFGITGDCNLGATQKTYEGNILFGTTEGIVKYNPAKDEKSLKPPDLNFTSLRISDVEYDYTKDIVLPYGIYKVRVEFIGLDYNQPEKVKYQYMLDGHDLEWSEPESNKYAFYSRLADGNYTFKLRACNAESICTETPITFNVTVKLPVWKRWWFIALVAVLLVLTVLVIIKVREKKQKELQEYLQRNLDERTREVVKQKEEIEVKNKDITDSINYAQRIQASILPSIKKIQSHFSGSFVYYEPRDIVSGDFYWFDLIKNDKFVIVCADSTGHGVPGAFMSMIGTTLIKDICARKDVNTPSDILLSLDTELTNTLNQNIEAERSNDGMDIIVCEIDIKTHYVRIASAMRPVILYQNGQQMYIKGSRNSIGGHINKESKVFENEGFQLSEGDIIYMFSDGYPDQFGGPMEKKFKMVRLKNMLKDIHQKPMDEQYQYVKNTFVLWKDEFEQVDDVLFMGIKI